MDCRQPGSASVASQISLAALSAPNACGAGQSALQPDTTLVARHRQSLSQAINDCYQPEPTEIHLLSVNRVLTLHAKTITIEHG